MYCWKCGLQLPDGTDACTACGASLSRPPVLFGAPVHRLEDDPAMRMLLPVGRSGLAVIAGYLGLLSVLPVFAPFAVLVGVLALRDIRDNPTKLGKGRAIFGIIMGVLGCFGLVWLIAMSAR